MREQPHLHLPPRQKTIQATLDLPGSKSIANRVLLLAAMAKGKSILHRVPDVSEDVCLMMEALKELGVSMVEGDTPYSYSITGCAGNFSVKEATIFCGNSGTTIRMLTALLAVLNGDYVLTGIERMKERPIEDLVESLLQLGANITYLEKPGYPPLSIYPFKDNRATEITCSGKDSSQYLTGLLMALSAVNRKTKIHIPDKLRSKSYVDMTLKILTKFGAEIDEKNLTYTLNSNKPLQAIEYTIEPDASSATYFLACAALNGSVCVNHLGKSSLQGDADFALILEKMGAKVVYTADSISVSADKPLRAVDVDMENMPDAAMTLAVLCLFAQGTSHIRGIGTWKIKETDRLLAMQTELRKLGAVVETREDSITITPPKTIRSGVAIDTYQDHRMAMSFSLVAAYGIEVIINDYVYVNKTFANYFQLFNQLCY